MPKNVEIDNLNWPQRLRIMESLKVSATKAKQIFGVSAKQLKDAQDEFQADSSFDALPYEPDFAARKPGRKGTNITEAYANVTETPQDIKEFALKNGVSVAVLKQRNSARVKEKIPSGIEHWSRKPNGVDSIGFARVDASPGARGA